MLDVVVVVTVSTMRRGGLGEEEDASELSDLVSRYGGGRPRSSGDLLLDVRRACAGGRGREVAGPVESIVGFEIMYKWSTSRTPE